MMVRNTKEDRKENANESFKLCDSILWSYLARILSSKSNIYPSGQKEKKSSRLYCNQLLVFVLEPFSQHLKNELNYVNITHDTSYRKLLATKF